MLRPVALLCALLPGLAGAETAFDPAAGGATCFVRRYGPAHLTDHPDQTVTQVGLLMDRSLIRDEGKLWLEFRLRPGQRRTQALALCRNGNGELVCDLEGDGGNFGVRRAEAPVPIRA